MAEIRDIIADIPYNKVGVSQCLVGINNQIMDFTMPNGKIESENKWVEFNKQAYKKMLETLQDIVRDDLTIIHRTKGLRST